ncbi:MAG: BolA family transcriptional regulator [Marinicaulis sp.]|nr:BolA family transcriptional regulator [Marinicaulis sp.]NNE39812.1 BolA family transcriptional regulator [Marinicaulis sp.]NNL90083.1 BolA family transcriptional regulator [Marinicaulis sp.]
MSIAQLIREKITAALAPDALEVIDESHLHAGHASAPAGGESHFRLLIVAEAFSGLSHVARQRLVNAALKEELAGSIHALSMKTLTPNEAASD